MNRAGITEIDLIHHLKAEGHALRKVGSTWWRTLSGGLLQPVHLLKVNEIGDLGSFSKFVPGLSTRCCNEHANACLPIHLMQDFQTFSDVRYSSVIRRHLRKARKKFSLELVSSEDCLTEAFACYGSSMTRTGRAHMPFKDFKALWSRRFTEKYGLMLGAREESSGRLAGFLWGYTVGTAGYVHTVAVHSAYLKENINALLVDAMLCEFLSAREVEAVSMGQHFRERPGIVEFKRKMGFPVVEVPAFVRLALPLRLIMRLMYPDKYYRFSGRRA